MVSINGLPPSQIPASSRSQRANRTEKRKGVNATSAATSETAAVEQPNKVAHAVSTVIQQMDASALHNAQLHYDLPSGRGRQAMDAYLQVMTQAQRDQLKQLLGVDIYI